MKTIDLMKKSAEELKELVTEKRTRIEELRFLLSQKKVKNVRELRELKRDVARMLTLLKVKK